MARCDRWQHLAAATIVTALLSLTYEKSKSHHRLRVLPICSGVHGIFVEWCWREIALLFNLSLGIADISTTSASPPFASPVIQKSMQGITEAKLADTEGVRQKSKPSRLALTFYPAQARTSPPLLVRASQMPESARQVKHHTSTKILLIAPTAHRRKEQLVMPSVLHHRTLL